ncbi:hypothetical protein HPB48_010091 [Haemaphysalis longicornis]|uniref:Uncharacterized protein n=1 Tax=Haemaphysalis longicornis TaxID=44386 RepID=A0A9J6FXJ6_HAELO|nr:hypothetical protein HPB48_010091 [Haemaphysalis longicornis]
MDQGIIETTEELYRKAVLRRMLSAYDASKGYNIDLLGALHLLNILWKELAPSKVANCFGTPAFPAPLSATLTMTSLMGLDLRRSARGCS